MRLPPLNLPECNLKIRKTDEQVLVWDVVRRKEIVLTPEEWVRQHFLHLMINHLGYPKSLMKLEGTLKYFQKGKRSDILLLDRASNPFLLVECKAPSVDLGKSAINQAAVYNKVVKASYLSISNGLKHFIWKQEKDGYVQLKEFPLFPEKED